ncbi:MAG: VWA domain-containing protein [Candidatus Obscuribacterales bacterium]|nr:VWA domain-containing protein [Candidatus Obscuribacterales bacterium]
MITFVSLWSMILTVPAVILAGLLLLQAWRNYRASNQLYGESNLIEAGSSLLSRRIYSAVCLAVCLGLLGACVGIARPQRQSDTAEFPQGTMDVICITDVSRSMAAQDYAGLTSGEAFAGGTRLDMARQIMRDRLIPALASNRLGIVSFAGNAFDQAYLGDDYKALTWVIENSLKIGSASGEGANIEAALLMALYYMDVDGMPNRHRLLIIFSDGGFDEESEKFAQIVTELAKRKVKVMLVGLGGRTPLAISVKQLGARDQYFMSGKTVLQLDGQTQLTARDDEALVKMAGKLNASYMRVNQLSDFQLDADEFELETQTRRSQEDLYRLPVLFAFAAIFAGQLCLLGPAILFRFKNEEKQS